MSYNNIKEQLDDILKTIIKPERNEIRDHWDLIIGKNSRKAYFMKVDHNTLYISTDSYPQRSLIMLDKSGIISRFNEIITGCKITKIAVIVK